jgi:hypothetical protein
MAELQGYFLKYKDDPSAAINNVSQMNSNIVVNPPEPSHDAIVQENESEAESDEQQTNQQVRGRRVITALELDKMPFNPQYDWEKDIYTGPK